MPRIEIDPTPEKESVRVDGRELKGVQSVGLHLVAGDAPNLTIGLTPGVFGSDVIVQGDVGHEQILIRLGTTVHRLVPVDDEPRNGEPETEEARDAHA